MDPRKPEKPTIPIIPRSVTYNQDASTVLREVFHDFLEEPTLPKNVVQNWNSYKLDSDSYKQTGEDIHNVLEQSKLEMEALQIVEKKLALNAINIKKEYTKQNNVDPIEKDLQKLRKSFIFPNIDQNDVKEYGLITSKNLLPSKIYQKLDFTYNIPSKPSQASDKQNFDELDSVPTKLPSVKGAIPKLEQQGQQQQGSKVNLAKSSNNNQVQQKNMSNTTATKVGLSKNAIIKSIIKEGICRPPKEKTKSQFHPSKGSLSQSKSSSKVSLTQYDSIKIRFDVNPVLFKNYTLHTVYKQRVRLQNVSSCTQKINVPKTTILGCFKVQPKIEPQQFKLCAGMSMSFTVYFKTDVNMDTEECFEINGCKLKLINWRDIPCLTVFVVRGFWPTKPPLNPRIDFARAEALNNTIDCGACFVGEHLTVYMIVKNTGGAGRFFLMTEEQWFTQEINTLHADLQLDFGSFSITPNYFELDPEEFCILQIDFFGSKSDTCVENLYLVCNNITWQSLDFIADVIVFDEYTVICTPSWFLTTFQFLADGQSSENEGSDEIQSEINYTSSNTSNNNPTISISSARDSLPPIANSDSGPLDNIDNSLTNMNSQQSAPAADACMRTSSVDCIDEVVFEYLLRLEQQKSVQNFSSCNEEQSVGRSGGIMFLGKTICKRELCRSVVIENNSMINLKFRWDMIEFDKQNYSDLLIYDLSKNGILIESSIGGKILPPYEKVEFKVKVRPYITEEAFYAISARFIIMDIPESAVQISPINSNFVILNANKSDDNMSSKKVDVQVTIINIVCFVMSLRIIIMPRNIFGSIRHVCGTILKREFKLSVDCNMKGVLTGHWVSNEKKRVMIYPEMFVIHPKIGMTFTAEFEVDSFHSTTEQITVIIENEYVRNIDLQIKVEPPHLQFDRTSLYFGLLVVGNVYQRKFKMINTNHVNLSWEIREQFKADLTDKNNIGVSAINLECGDVEITYRIEAMEPLEWNSHLLLYSLFGDKRTQECSMHIQFDVTDGSALIHTPYSPCPILSPSEALQLGVMHAYPICFHNHSLFEVCYKYCGCHGEDANHVRVDVYPQKFVIPSHRSRRIDVSITPWKSAILDNIFLDFVIVDESSYRTSTYTAPSPVTVTVMIAVDDIYVKVILPGDMDREERALLWPPRATDSYAESTDEDLRTLPPLEETAIEPINLPLHFDLTENEMEMDVHALPPDLVQYLKSLEPDYVIMESTTMKSSSTKSSFSSDTTVDTLTTCRYAECGFENMSPEVIKICNVPQRKLYNFAIKLQNQTPIPGEISVRPNNFPALEYNQTKFEKILKNLNYTSDESIWEKRLGPHGILVGHNYADGKLQLAPYGESQIELIIYANTWGTYKEELVIDINNILPMQITVLIEIVGVPLEFPIGINNIHKTAILRFGTLAYQSKFEIRRLQVRNISMIPVSVVWHIFMRHSHEERAKEPVTVLFDVYHTDDDDLHEEEKSMQGNLMIAHGKCVGKSDHRIFKMYPREMEIPANDTVTLKIGVNAKVFAASYDRKDIEAYLIGYVHLPIKLRSNPSLYQRPTGHNNDPAKAKITACLDLPVLQLDMTEDDLRFAFFADKILTPDHKRQSRHLTFKNLHAATADVRFRIDEPYTLQPRPGTDLIEEASEDETCWYSLEVAPGNCAQLTISYTLDDTTITRMVKCLFDESSDDVEYFSKLDVDVGAFTIVRYLHIEQKGFVRQNIEIPLKVYFPNLEYTKIVEFGVVYIGNVAKMFCTFKNYSVCRIEFKISTPATFRIIKESGVIEAGRKEFPSIYDLQIFFIPQIQKKFEDEIVLKTQIPGLSYKINVSGIGRHDEKYFRPDTC